MFYKLKNFIKLIKKIGLLKNSEIDLVILSLENELGKRQNYYTQISNDAEKAYISEQIDKLQRIILILST